MNIPTLVALIGAVALALTGVFSVRYYNSLRPSTTPPPLLVQSPPTTSTNAPTTPPTLSLPPSPAAITPQPSKPTSKPEQKLPTNPPLQPTVKPTPYVPIKETTEPKIEFINLPSEVSSGQQFTATWEISGPDGASGEDATLKVSYEKSSNSSGSSSSVSSKTSQSFGSFKVPKTFSTKLTFGDSSGPINIDASAIVSGQLITAHRTVQLR